MKNLAVSPCSNPEMSLEEAFRAYSEIGYHKFEAFTGWVKSALDWRSDPGPYAEKARRSGMSFSAMHLPPITDELEESLAQAIEATRFAAALNARIVLFKATSRPNYIQAAKAFLDATESLDVIPVLQNHAGGAISSLEDFSEVMEGISDSRMKTLLEVGHFHAVGVLWQDGCELLGETIAHVHIKDQVGAQSVPFGSGEIDLRGLLEHMAETGFTGNYVVEMEVEDNENTVRYLADALQYIELLEVGG